MAEGHSPQSAGEAYDLLATTYAAGVATKPHNAYYERPATMSLLPEVRGLRVLDAGCGAGTYTSWLLAADAEVVALDASAEMVRITRQAVGDAAQVLQADLGQPLSMFEPASFDLVLSPLVLDFVRDWRATFGEFHRVLRPQGLLVFSVDHPFHDYVEFQADDYFATEAVQVEYSSLAGARVPTFRRPLSAIMGPLIDAGFAVERLLEPQPTEEFRLQNPEGYARLMRRPMFLCVRARKV